MTTIQELEEMASNGDAQAMNDLAFEYEEMGDRLNSQEIRADAVIIRAGSIPQKVECYRLAVYWWRKAASLGNNVAKLNLARLHTLEARNSLYRIWERQYSISIDMTYDKQKADQLCQEVISDENAPSEMKEAARGIIGGSRSGGGGGGCYVATCIYGSYDCPEVWTLRDFRDHTLSKHWYGRLFIRIYYATSPGIVHLFGNKKLFHSVLKPIVDKIVERLQDSDLQL